MANASKAKGSRGERLVSDALTNIFGLNFERVPNSGAFVGGKNSGRLDRLTRSQQLLTEGDLIVPEELYNMKIECKTYKKFSWNLVYSECSQLDDWIEQARDTKKIWFLTIKINYCDTCVVFDADLLDKERFILGNHTHYKHYIITDFISFFKKNKVNLLHLCEKWL